MAYLLLHSGERVSRARLAAALWPDELADEARSNVRRHLHHIAKALPELDGVSWFVADKSSVGWNVDAPATIDVIEFERLVRVPSSAAQGAALYEGDLIETLYDEWILAERGRLQALAIGAMYAQAIAARSRRDFLGAIAWAERILRLDEWREDALRVLMSARYESGDRTSAVAAYVRFSHHLNAEMRVEPMPETTALRDAILADADLAERGTDVAGQSVSANVGTTLHLPFVGRERTIENLRAVWLRAARRSGSTILITGEAGVGKSRLASELANIVEAQGGRTLIGMTSNPENCPYQPLVDALRRGLPYLSSASIDPLWLSVVAPLIPEVLALRPGLPPAETIDPERARTRLHEAFARLFEIMSRSRPLLLILEDLHWTQADTIDALTILARRAGGMPLLIVATFRGDSETHAHPLHEMRRALQGERRATLVALARLDADDIAELVDHMPHGREFRDVLASAAYRVSEGNPLFASQLLANYAETGVLPDEARLDLGVSDAIAGRVERLDPLTRAVADVAATIGREFAVDLVCDVGGWTQDEVFDALGRLMDRHLIRETGAPGFEYGFTHALIAHAIASRSEVQGRIARHRRVAQCLARANDPGSLIRTAYHWKEAGERDYASKAYLNAARQAMSLYARGDSIDSARAAAALSDDPQRRFEALSLAVKAEEGHGSIDPWEHDLRELDAAAAGLGDEQRFVALEGWERFFAATGNRESQRRVIAAMRELGKRGDAAHRHTKAQDALGTLELAIGRPNEAIAPLRDAVAGARSCADRLMFSRVQQHLIAALVRLGNTAGAAVAVAELRAHCGSDCTAEERLDVLWAESSLALATEDATLLQRVATEMLSLAKRSGDSEIQARALWRLGWAATSVNDVVTARKEYGAAAQLFERLHQPHPLATTLINLGVLETDMGQPDHAIENFRRAAILAEKCGSLNVQGYALANTADAQRLQGEYAAAYVNALRANEVAILTGEHRLRATALCTLGVVECASGEAQAGLAHMREGIDLWRSAQSSVSLVNELCVLIESLHAADDRTGMIERASELSALLEENPNQRHPARGAFALALCSKSLGDVQRARALQTTARALLKERLASYPDEAAKSAYRALPFNRAIVEYAM